MKRKFNKKIQGRLNKFFYNEEYHEYTVEEVLKIALANVVIITLIIAFSCI